jgi:hypothetical protein
MHIGGADPLRVLRLEFAAQKVISNDQERTAIEQIEPMLSEESDQYHSLFDSHVVVKNNPKMRLMNEVKRIGYLIDVD